MLLKLLISSYLSIKESLLKLPIFRKFPCTDLFLMTKLIHTLECSFSVITAKNRNKMIKHYILDSDYSIFKDFIHLFYSFSGKFEKLKDW